MGWGIWSAVLFAALLHASWQGIVKAGKDSTLTMGLVFAGIALWAIPFVITQPLPHGAWGWLIPAVAAHFLYKLGLLAAYRHGDFGHVYPLARGSAPLFTTIGATVLLEEAPNSGEAIGIGLIISGIMLLTFRGGPNAFRNPRPVIYALLTGLATACYSLTDTMGARAAPHPLSFLAWLMLIDGFVWILFLLGTRGKAFVRHLQTGWKTMLLGGGLAISGFSIALWAMAVGQIAVVAALREVSVVFATLIGALIFREGFGPWRMAASLLIVAGAFVAALNYS